MRLVRHFALAACTAWQCFAAPVAAAPADSNSTLYVLVTPPSALTVGCQGPCACPLVSLPTYGSFSLVRTGADPLYTHYAVERYIASFNNGPGAVAITGSGQYRIGGEVALVHQLTLDLQVWGGPVQHFDSGLVPVRSTFPRLDIACAVNGFACFDSVLTVNAKPVDPADSPPAPPAATGLQAVRPNPSRGATSIDFTLPSPGPVTLSIVDVGGREVRVLADARVFGAGVQSVTWDGRREDGRPAPSGVYWALLREPGGATRRRFVKLD